MRIRQSDLSSYARCPRQKKYIEQARQGDGPAGLSLSATVYGTVMHYAIQTLETLHHEKRKDALAVARATFHHYWDPENISEIAEPVDIWIAQDTYAGLKRQGDRVIGEYYEYLLKSPGQLLGLEVNFNLPYVIDGVEHELSGTIDRLAIRKRANASFISVEDFKTGKQPTFLRHNMQFTVYSYATLQPEFWTPWEDGANRHAAYSRLARRGTWVNLKNNRRSDAGWRAERDYKRMDLAIREYVRAVELDVYPLSMTGEVCEYCPFREICGGVPVPDDDYGMPS